LLLLIFAVNNKKLLDIATSKNRKGNKIFKQVLFYYELIHYLIRLESSMAAPHYKHFVCEMVNRNLLSDWY